MPMSIRPAVESDRAHLAALAAPLQRRPDRHVVYLGTDPDTIAAEMIEEDDDWTTASVVAERDGSLVGWLMGSIDPDMGRVWWFGPFVDASDWSGLADELFAAAYERLPSAIHEHEMAVDERFTELIEWAPSHGFAAETGSVVLTLDRPLASPELTTRPTTADDVATVGALHDELFPGTHTTGARLVAGNDDTHVRLVAEHDGVAIGYVAVERQPDGSGYVDFVGVAPAWRGRGIGGELIRAGVATLGPCDGIHLTVRADNAAARALYARLGFTEERVVVPLRRGFSLES